MKTATFLVCCLAIVVSAKSDVALAAEERTSDARLRTDHLEPPPVAFDGASQPLVLPAQPVPPPVPALSSLICSRPAKASLQMAMTRSRLAGPFLVLVDFEWNAEGIVGNARLKRTTGDSALDAAVLVWVSKFKFCPGVAGRGTFPLHFSVE